VLPLCDLRRLGASKSAIGHPVSKGQWTRPHREVYVVAPELAGTVRTRARAALTAAPITAVASHLLAGHLHGLAGLPTLTTPELTAPQPESRRVICGLVLHTSREIETTEIHGLTVTPVARTLADLASALTDAELLSALDSALHLGLLDPATLAALRRVTPGRDADARLARLRAIADGRCASPLESGIRLVLINAGLGPVELQIEVVVDGRTFRIDLGFPDVKIGIEGDGRAFHSSPDAVLEDRWRQNALLGDGWLILRFTWYDVLNRPQYIVDSVARALAARAA
jgi:very-short-patch-repair endonuclease